MPGRWQQPQLGIHRGSVALQVVFQLLDAHLLGGEFALALHRFHFAHYAGPHRKHPGSGGADAAH